MSADTPEKQFRLWYYSAKYYALQALLSGCGSGGTAIIQADMDAAAESYNDLAGLNQQDRRHPPPPIGGPPPPF